MAFYQITIKTRKSRPQVVVRQYENRDLEYMYRWLYAKSVEQYGKDLLQFNCVMISKHSEAAKDLVAARKDSEVNRK